MLRVNITNVISIYVRRGKGVPKIKGKRHEITKFQKINPSGPIVRYSRFSYFIYVFARCLSTFDRWQPGLLADRDNNYLPLHNVLGCSIAPAK